MDPFATLGLPRSYALDRSALEARYRELQKTLHPDRHVGKTASERRMHLNKAVEVNEAYRVVRDSLRRAQSLLELLGASPSASSQADPEFLMEMMELREGLSEAKAASDLERVREMADTVAAQARDTEAKVAERFAKLADPPASDALGAITDELARLKYFRRFQDEVDVIEEEALE